MVQKIVIIRDDDIKDDDAALEWYCNLIISKGVRSALACIPNKLSEGCITYLKNLDQTKFEFASHGYNHDGIEDPVTVLPAAYALMTSLFGKPPLSIAAPNSDVPAGYEDMANLLGYRSQCNFFNFPYPRTLYTFPITFCWEADWGSAPNWIVTYYAYSDFKGEFDSWYANYSGTQPWFVGGNYQVFVMNIHHEPLYDDNNPTAAQARIDFAASIDYILSKGDVQILTEEQAVQALGGTGNQNMVTIFSDGFE